MAKPPFDASWAPVEFDDYDIAALKALEKGVADEVQQKRALDCVIRKIARTYDLSYRPASERETCFAEGRRFTGLQIIKVLHYQPRTDNGKRERGGPGTG